MGRQPHNICIIGNVLQVLESINSCNRLIMNTSGQGLDNRQTIQAHKKGGGVHVNVQLSDWFTLVASFVFSLPPCPTLLFPHFCESNQQQYRQKQQLTLVDSSSFISCCNIVYAFAEESLPCYTIAQNQLPWLLSLGHLKQKAFLSSNVHLQADILIGMCHQVCHVLIMALRHGPPSWPSVMALQPLSPEGSEEKCGGQECCT